MQFVDLSVAIGNDMPVFPGDPKTELKQLNELQKNGFADHCLCINTHTGTHVDAPNHMLIRKKEFHQFPLMTFTDRGVYIRFANKKFDLAALQNKQFNVYAFPLKLSVDGLPTRVVAKVRS